ncbi:MAG TPA: DUF5668 domain-containing protein [Bryobacteraceae bacterium]|nr:DUF5668 domain-containing protein [Bryobacteraceae bacterium]HPT25023.1 DUF5668 domain-containing protein [Bryobacteraceae bacterium]
MNTGTAALMRAIRGPVMLMALGILLTFHRFSDVSIGKTWPVLLIIYGLMKLFQRTAGQVAERSE